MTTGSTPVHADIIIKNARIATMSAAQPSATTLAITNGLFSAVGTETDVMPHRGPMTRIIDAKNQTLIPGLNDSHTHVIRGGRFYNLELRWDGVPTLAQALEMLRDQVSRTPPGQWIRVVGGWSEFQFRERRMPKVDELNAIAPNTPVFVLHLYHLAILNKAALAYAGIDKTSVELLGTLIQRDASGEATGLLLAKPNAAILYQTLGKGPVLGPEDELNSTRHFLRELNRFGITSISDAGGGTQNFPDDYRIYAELANQGELTIRTAYSLMTQRPGHELEDYVKWSSETSPNDGNDFLKINGAGELIVYEGYDYENFAEPQPSRPDHMADAVRPVLREIVKHGHPFRLHATYDESIDLFLGIIEDLAMEFPISAQRWWFDHGETVSPRNIERIAALNGGIAIQDRLAFQGEVFLSRYGAEKAANAPPIADMLAGGVHIGAGTDATRVSSYNPFVSLYWLHTGATVGGLATNGIRNRLSREKALELFTVGSAWMSGDSGKKGAIVVGQFADLAVLSADYFAVPAEEIKRIESLLTIVGGKIVYAAGSFASLAPPPIRVSPDWSPVRYFPGYYRGEGARTASPAASLRHACSHMVDDVFAAHHHGFMDLCSFG
jgi:predicted amidohydrolase YtcJ